MGNTLLYDETVIICHSDHQSQEHYTTYSHDTYVKQSLNRTNPLRLSSIHMLLSGESMVTGQGKTSVEKAGHCVEQMTNTPMHP